MRKWESKKAAGSAAKAGNQEWTPSTGHCSLALKVRSPAKPGKWSTAEQNQDTLDNLRCSIVLCMWRPDIVCPTHSYARKFVNGKSTNGSGATIKKATVLDTAPVDWWGSFCTDISGLGAAGVVLIRKWGPENAMRLVLWAARVREGLCFLCGSDIREHYMFLLRKRIEEFGNKGEVY